MLDRKRLGHLKGLAIRLNDKEYLQLIEQSERAIDLDERNLKEQSRIIEIAENRLKEIRRLQDENKNYQEALGFYANRINYKPMHYDLNVDKWLSKIDYDEGYEAQVRPRSGITSKTKLRVQLGTIDNDYTGEIGIIVDNVTEDTYKENMHVINQFGPVIHDIKGNNISNHAFNCVKGMFYKVKKGDKLAQLVIQPLPQVETFEIDELDELDETERGNKGFGSSGYK